MPPRKRQRLEIHDADPEGDTVIEVGKAGRGKQKTLIRASKKVLTSSSPVFDTMLGPNFAEGQVDHTVEEPLKLPDDDGSAMLILFQIIHNRLLDVSNIDLDKLPRLVLAGDKYSCFDVLRPWLQLALGRWRETHDRTFCIEQGYLVNGVEKMTLGDAFYTAYLIDDSITFEWLSHEVLHCVQLVAVAGKRSIVGLSSLLDDLVPKKIEARIVNICEHALNRTKEVYLKPLKEAAERAEKGMECLEGDRRLMVYVKKLMLDERFYTTDPAWLLKGITRPRPLLQLTGMTIPGPVMLPPRPEEERPAVDRALIRREASEKCGNPSCLCRDQLGIVVGGCHFEAMMALGCICLPCFKKGGSKLAIIPFRSECQTCGAKGKAWDLAFFSEYPTEEDMQAGEQESL
ncbi:uncharacterized protein AB675_1989 [Cyphellophora attinorum]|uniref:BTB domain-containing protein n=1 Tax=Cyphellophora attinorum TaxID=1664694 RepID=A0A0N1H803_9EURO|nr:uncharacterized protein AB675_1989 [Phialophora attinorum]KPI42877.1 hypothetical protein AB675_1989 [Phialophora attinorum]